MNIKWSIEETKKLKTFFQENKTSKEICILLGKSLSSVQNKASRMNLKFKRIKYQYADDEISFLKSNYPYGSSRKEEMEQYLKRSWSRIKAMANRYNIKVKNEFDPTALKNNFKNLLKNTNETYYWIGFLLADGCFDVGRKSISLEISKKDENHLDKFIKFLNYGKKSHRRDNVCVSGSDFANMTAICEKFNIKSNKTENPPDVLLYQKFNPQLLFSLIVGFIDGDGNIRKVGKNSNQITIENHCLWKDFHIMVEKFLFSYFGFYYDDHQRFNCRGYSCLSICQKGIIRKIKEKIISLKLPMLERKWDKI